MSQSGEEKNKSIVLEAFETLFNKRDYRNALTFWSPKYFQHSAHRPERSSGRHRAFPTKRASGDFDV